METKWIITIVIIVIIMIALILGLVLGLKDKKKSNSSFWVAVGADENHSMLWSEDGKEWQASNGLSFSYEEGFGGGNGVAYGTGNGTDPLWVAVGTDDNYSMLWSEDGKEWQLSNGLSFSYLDGGLGGGNGVAYGTSNGTDPLWVAVGNDENHSMLWSEDGKEWQLSSGLSFSNLNDAGFGVAYGTSNGTDPLWVAVGVDENHSMLWSEDGKEWQVSSGLSFSNLNDAGFGVAYGTSNGTDPLWVAVGADENHSILWSEDGKEWRPSSGLSFSYDGGLEGGNGVAYGTSNGTDPLWVAVGTDDNHSMLWSEDGKEWQASSGVSFSYDGGVRVAYGTINGTDPLWVAVGQYENHSMLWSEDGKEWRPSSGLSFSYDGGDGGGNGVASNILNPALKGSSIAPPFH